MLKTSASIVPQKVGEPAGHAIASGSSRNSSTSSVAPPSSHGDQSMTCSRCNARFLRKDGWRDHSNLRDHIRVVLCPNCFSVAEIETTRD